MIQEVVEDKREVEVTCYHCGELCVEEKIDKHKHSFCCSGCVTVYEILSENGLSDYYSFETNPGTLKKEQVNVQKYDYLDLESIQNVMLKFKNEGQSVISLHIPDIHCSSCIWLLEHLYKLHPGIVRSRVNFVKKTALLYFKPDQIKLSALALLLDQIGYPPKITLEQTKKSFADESKMPIYKIGVAGFCFGNIMLLSFPEYFGLDGLQDPFYLKLFTYLNLGLSLPVFFFSGIGYLQSALKGIKQKFINIDVPIALGLVALLVRTVYEVLSQTGPGYADSLAGLVFFLLIGKWFQSKTYENLNFERDYKSFFPLAITKIVNGTSKFVPVQEIEIGDTLQVRNGEIIPTDAILTSDQAMIDYSFVTGESEPQRVKNGAIVYAGGKLQGQAIEVEVQKKMSQSYLTSLWNHSSFKESKSKTQKLLDSIAHYFTIAIVLVAVITSVIWLFIDASKVWLIFSSILIVACPCALALSVPFTFGNGIRVFGLNKFYLRNTDVIETLSDIDVVVFDKTGTLTTPDKAEVVYQGAALSSQEKSAIAATVSNSTHPLSRRIFDFLGVKGEKPELSSFMELAGRGVSGNVDGHRYMLGSASHLGLDLPKTGLNTSMVYLKKDDIHIGSFIIKSAYRPFIKELISKIQSKCTMFLLSGDNDGEKETLKNIGFSLNQMHFDQKPENKLDFIQSIQLEKSKVMMVGDGLNDAGALKQSEVGVAVTDDVALFSPSCDGIIEGQELSNIPAFLQLARHLKTVVILSVGLSLLYNIGGLSFAVTGNLTPVFAAILMPLSSISVVIFTSVLVRILSKKLKFKI